MRIPLIYKDRPIFGLDIGSHAAKLVQVKLVGREVRVVGYGSTEFPPESIIEGIIADPEAIVAAIKPILAKTPVGKITATRVAASLPVAKVFTRSLQLPLLNASDLEQAVRLEAEQYVPVPITDLYIDHEVIETSTDASGVKHLEVLMVAAPRAIVDSYLKLIDMLGLEPGFVEMSLSAIARAMISTNRAGQTALVMDIGSNSSDITVYDKVLRLTGTIASGGDNLTETLVKTLEITPAQANEIKYKFGIGASGLQGKVVTALEPQLKAMVAEIKRVMKYYRERSANQHDVQTIVLSGGSASMPGLVDYLYEQLKLPIIMSNAWAPLEVDPLPRVDAVEAPMYTTAIGLALLETKR